MNALKSQIEGMSPPINYFHGRQWSNLRCIDNLIMFVRHTRQELQQRTFESRPHHRYVLVLALESEGIVAINRNPFPLKENEGLLIPPYQFHQFLDLDRNELLWLIITFEFNDPDYLAVLRDRIFTLDEALRDQLASIVANYRKQPEVHRNAEILLSMTLFLTRIKEKLGPGLNRGQSVLRTQSGPGQDLLARIDRAMIQDAWNGFPKVHQLAKKLGYSESRLRALFKEHFELSLGSYLRNYQIHTAISLMKNSELSLTDIAFASGFSSASVFTRAFRRHTHSTPRDYRRNMLRIP